MGTKVIYFDNAASTPVDDEVLDHVQHLMRNTYGNPSSLHWYGREARVVVEQSRRTVARLLNVSPAEIFFTSGGTEANNAVLWGCCKDLGIKHFITSPLEHPAVLKTLEQLQSLMGIHIHFVNVGPAGHVDLDHLESLLKQHTPAVVSLMHANNEIGNLLPVKAVSDLCQRYQALFHSDTVQTVGKLAMDMKQPAMDFAVASAHKFHGPKGAGFMYVGSASFFKHFITGGGQERNMRGGTENVYGIAGTAKALEVAHRRMTEDKQHISLLKKKCVSLLRQKVPSISFNGDTEGSSLHTIINVTLPEGLDAEMLLPNLDIAGICVSTGSACASGSDRGSYVLEALGADMQRPSVRISFSRYNTMEEVRQFVDVLTALV